MSKFRVGQEVRLISTGPGQARVPTKENPSIRLGTIGTIIKGERYYQPMENYNPGGLQYLVVFEGVRSTGTEGGFTAFEYQLEPIYDGDQKSSWDECLWVPKPIKARSDYALAHKE